MGALLAADTLHGPKVDWFALSPILILLGGAMVLLLGAALTPAWPKRSYALFTAAVGAAAAVMAFILWSRINDHGAKTLVGDAMWLDKPGIWITMTVCIGLIIAALLTDDYLRREGIDGPELYALYMLASIGAVVMASANDLIVLFLGLEILSIALYVMAASHRKRSESQESGLKYFILGGYSSAFLLYGIALIYGSTGSTNLGKILTASESVLVLDRSKETLLLAGVALLLVGLAFKVAAVPFHFWAPDVYQGAPPPVTAFMASVGKAAAFAAMLRILLTGLPHWADDYRPAIWLLAVLTLVGGSVMAVVQTNVKRMLAFSSISHAGYILVGVEAAAHDAHSGLAATGVSSVLVYLLVYTVLVGGTFGVITAVSRTGDGAADLAGFRGLGRTKPALALGMTVLLLAQAGVPLTSGFVAKFGVIGDAVRVHSYGIAIIAMVSAVIAAFLYLRIMISMWIADPEAGDDTREAVQVPALLLVAITLAVGFTLAIGFFPDWLIHAAP
ncbi:MAG: NADH-quinone oxidoreductase subunit N [Actinomycetota bacterium]